jgi:hypothetical protein
VTGFGREGTLTQYLLGRSTPAERAEIEERLFLEDDSLDELQSTTDDLIHAYLAGSLPAADRELFEAHFLEVPRHRERLAFVRDLLSAVERVSPRQGPARPRVRGRGIPAWRLSAAAALVLAAAGVWWSVRSVENDHAPRVAGPPGPPPIVTATGAPRTDGPGSEVRIGLGRPGTRKPVEIPVSADTRTIRLEVPLADADAPSYNAVIRDERGRDVWRARDIEPPPRGKALVLTVPALLLRAALYTLRVEGEVVRSESDEASVPQEFFLRVVPAN